jgi:uncharacterized membrane protein YesL
MLTQTLKQWLWDCYDCLWRLVAANMLVAVPFLVLFFLTRDLLEAFADTPGLMLIVWCALFVTMFPALGAPWFAGIVHFGSQNSIGEDATFRDMLHGVRRHGWRVWRYLMAMSTLLAVLAVNAWFYLSADIFPEGLAILKFALLFLCVWLLAFVGGAMLHGLAFCVRSDLPVRRILRMSFTLAVALPRMTFGVLAFLVGLWIVSGSCQFAGYLLFAFAATAMMVNSLHDVTLVWEEHLRGTSDAETLAAREETRRLRYDRGWREILKPWEV